MGDADLIDAYLNGRFIPNKTSTMFADVFNPAVHILDKMPPFDEYSVTLRVGLDHGTSSPFCALLCLRFDCDMSGYPAGSVFVIGETHSAIDAAFSKGDGSSPVDISDRTVIMCQSLGLDRVPPVYADDARNFIGETLVSQLRAALMDDVQAASPAMKQRKEGYALIRAMLQNATGDTREPGLYILGDCEMLLSTLPIVKRSKLNRELLSVDAKNDHAIDALKIALMSFLIDPRAGKRRRRSAEPVPMIVG
jgi:hypothetical protein